LCPVTSEAFPEIHPKPICLQVIKTQPDVRLRKAASKNGSALVQPEIGYFLGLVCADRM